MVQPLPARAKAAGAPQQQQASGSAEVLGCAAASAARPVPLSQGSPAGPAMDTTCLDDEQQVLDPALMAPGELTPATVAQEAEEDDVFDFGLDMGNAAYF